MSEKANELKELELSAEKLAIKDTRKYMFDMFLLLTAPAIMAWYYYGSRALWLICICVITSILTESITSAVIKTKMEQRKLQAHFCSCTKKNLPTTI